MIESLLPGFRDDLLAAGAVPYDSGRMPWLGEYGWSSTGQAGYEVLSATRPLMEAVTRKRVTGLDGPADSRRGDRHGSEPDRRRLADRDRRRLSLSSQLVIDASGRSSRLSRWSVVPQDPIEEEVDAHVGYACRLYRELYPLPVRAGVMILASAECGRAGLAVPVEQRQWLVAGAGFGDRRPPRDEDGFGEFLTDLRDPAIADLVALLEPVSDVSIHRQTANRRRRWDRVPHWPTGLLVVGDALCSLNPVYGQGITVAAQQAQVVSRALERGHPVDRALQRRMVAVTEAPWSIATTADLRQPTCPGEPNPVQRISVAWVAPAVPAGRRRRPSRVRRPPGREQPDGFTGVAAASRAAARRQPIPAAEPARPPGRPRRAQSRSSGPSTGGPSRRLTSSRVSASVALLSGR